MHIKRLISVIAAVMFFLGSFVPTALAAGTCYCNIEGTGAQPATGGATNSASCKTACDGTAKSTGYQWAADASMGPSSLLQCFSTKELCEKDLNRDKVADGKFDSKYQPPECLPGWHYCYPNDTEKYELQISIPNPSGGETTSVYNYGEYIGIVYKYLVGISVTIAIVFVMIGGIRYVIGASSGDIGKAKDMIKKAIAGLVLLLFAYVILYTVNPELIKLQVPKLPMLRRVELLTGGQNCEDLVAGEGYVIDEESLTDGHYGKKECGSIANLVEKPDGTKLAEGTTCVYSLCEKVDSSCGSYDVGYESTGQCVGVGNDWRCITCGQAYPGGTCNLTPNAEMCSQLDAPDRLLNLAEENSAYEQYNLCGYTQDPTMFSSAVAAGFTLSATFAAGLAAGPLGAGAIGSWYTADVIADTVVGSCADLSIQCNQVVSCTDYNGWQVANTKTDNELDDLDWPFLNDVNIVEVCNADPCGVRTVEGKSGETCEYNGTEGNCQASGYAPAEADYSGGRPGGRSVE